MLEGVVEVRRPGFEIHGHGIGVGYGSVEDDVTRLRHDRIVVVRVEPVPSPLLKAAAVAQALARCVKALNGGEGIGRIDPSRAGLGEQLGVILGIEVVDIDFEAANIDEVFRTKLRSVQQPAEVEEVGAVELVQEEVRVADVLVVFELEGVDGRSALEGLAIGLALFVAGHSCKGQRPDVPLSADAEKALVPLPEADEARVGQL